MKLAVDVPNFGPWADPDTVASLAADAEAAGWDGFSVWDHILFFSGAEVGDPWVLLTVAAAATDRIRLFSLVTPVPRRRPWVLARQAVTLDHYSGGRLTLGVGIGAPAGPEFGVFGEPTDARMRADMLDEGLEIIVGMWSGEPFSFAGVHYSIEENVFRPQPVQTPRIPIWVAGAWPTKRPFRRAAQWDGVVPMTRGPESLGVSTPAELTEMKAYIDEHRKSGDPYDIAAFGIPTEDPGRMTDTLAEYAAAGVTWLRFGPHPEEDAGDFCDWVRRGPPG